MRDSLVICFFAIKNERFARKNSWFSLQYVFGSFHCFSPSYAQVRNRVTVSDLLRSLFCYFAHEKRVFRSKNQRANSQPCSRSYLKLLRWSWRCNNVSLAITLANDFWSWVPRTSPVPCTCRHPLCWWAVKAGECSHFLQIF